METIRYRRRSKVMNIGILFIGLLFLFALGCEGPAEEAGKQLDSQVGAARKEVDDLKQQIEDYKQQIETARQELSAHQEQLQQSKQELERLQQARQKILQDMQTTPQKQPPSNGKEEQQSAPGN